MIKKLFDKYVAQSSKGQIVSLALAFVILVVVGGFVGKTVASADKGDSLYDFGRPETWGFMQCVDGGFVQATIRNNTVRTADDKVQKEAPVSVILLSLGFWLGGMILVAFFTGAATDFLSSRREKILSGDVDYRFARKYALIVGFDFQVKNLIKSLLKRPKIDVVLITDRATEEIYGDLMPELKDDADLSSADAKRVFVMRKDLAVAKTYDDFMISGADEIYLMGDGDTAGRDGRTLRALELIAKKAKGEFVGKSVPKSFGQIPVYMHIEDSVLYSQLRAVQLPADNEFIESKVTIFNLEVFNYYESWAWRCWAQKDSDDGTRESAEGECDRYLPIRHIEGSRHVHLFVIGAGRMGRAMVNFALPLMNYGEDGKHCKVTVFDPDALKKAFLPDRSTLEALPEVDVEFKELDGCSDEANDLMLAAAEDADTSVTVVVALPEPGAAIRAYSELSNRLRRKNISALVWQATESGNCPSKKYLKMGGPGKDKEHPNLADNVHVRYFGMTDQLPWKDSARSHYGMAVSYFYNCWFPGPRYDGTTFDETKQCFVPVGSPRVTDADFIERAMALCKDGLARSRTGSVSAADDWAKMPRWKRWASVNSGDAFKERSLIFRSGLSRSEAMRTALKAEHNRWWTEKLLGGWIPDARRSPGDESHADKQQMIHGDMVPFEELSEGVKDKDKINIAAMAACGFIPSKKEA